MIEKKIVFKLKKISVITSVIEKINYSSVYKHSV